MDLEKASNDAPLVTVIVPVYNCEAYLRRCLDSIFAQTMRDFEVIAVNDGSTDASPEILREYAAKHGRLRLLEQANAGQGVARNRALENARGRFVLFVDADDFIESVTLQVTTERMLQDDSDLVHFDWKLYDPSPAHTRVFNYYNVDPFWNKRVLVDEECDELLRVQNFFSVSYLYRRSFLNEHRIRFEEGRIYEDNPFVVRAVNRATLVSLVHSPLYVVNPHEASTTRSNTDSERHYRDHIYAMRRSFEALNDRNPRAAAYLTAYHVKKLGPYYKQRVPRRYRRAYIREFVDVVHGAQVTIPPNTGSNRPTRLSMRLRIFERQRYLLFQSIIVGKNFAMPKVKRARAELRRWKHRNQKDSAEAGQLEAALKQSVRPGTITFLGFDEAYAGNSRYLFDRLIEDVRFAGHTIRFVTEDPRVPERYRLMPGDLETNVALARSEVVVAESWVPAHVRKHPNSTWVQLWHGTPLKRMLFDSHEPRITSKRRHHKTNKYRDIQHWDYLLVDCEAAAEKFETAFLFPKNKMVHAGYPRVEYLREHASDRRVRREVLGRLGLAEGDAGTVVLYAPTWRDYNYARRPEQRDLSYKLDVAALADELGPEYTVLFHDHGYLSTRVSLDGTRCVDASQLEIQELLLACDAVVSDYSSVIFDAFAIDRQVVLYAIDEDRFEETRGLYSDIWSELSALSTASVGEVATRIRAGADMKLAEELRTRYGSAATEDLADVLLAHSRSVLNGRHTYFQAGESALAVGTGAERKEPVDRETQ